MSAFGLLAFLSLQAAAGGDQPQPTPDEEVVVTGRADALERFVEGLTEAPRRDQLPRWNEGVCPRTLGLEPAQAAYVIRRIRSIAEQNKVPVAPANCNSNVLIAVTDQADSVARRIANYAPRFLQASDHGRPTRAQVARWVDPQPVRWLHATRLGGADGTEYQQDFPIDVSSVGDAAGEGTNKIWGHSLVTSPTQRNMSVAILIVDPRRLGEVTWGQLSAHLAMLAFTRAEPEATAVSGESILSLFHDRGQGRPGVRTLTAWDRAFLKALYATPTNIRSARQRVRIRDHMRRELAADLAGDAPATPASDQRE